MFYFEIKSVNKSMQEIERLFEIFHQNCYLHNNSIGVSFPYQNNGQLCAIRFFSKTKESLNKLINCDDIQDLLDTDAFLLKTIKEVPKDAIPFRVLRSRIDSSFKYAKEIKNKHLKTNNIFKNGSLKELYYIKIYSKTNVNYFSLFYYYDAAENTSEIDNNIFSSYGFSKGGSYVYSF